MDAALTSADYSPALPPSLSGYTVHRAASPLEVLDAQRLRYQIFALEKGAQIDGGAEGLDVDSFDRFCDHLLVRDRWGRLIGTTRALRQENALRAGGFYSETEFEMMPSLRWSGRLLEIGRTCIHPDHRNGAAIGTLWSGIADLIFEGSYDRLIGCASIEIEEEGFGKVKALVDQILARHLAHEDRRAQPKIPLPAAAAAPACSAPPLLKAYLRLGAQISGDAFYDADFGCADLLVQVDRERLNLRYARHFLKAS
jgi:putative hemolysin